MRKSDLVIFRMYKMQLPKFSASTKCSSVVDNIVPHTRTMTLSRRILDISPNGKNILINLHGKKHWLAFDPVNHKIISNS